MPATATAIREAFGDRAALFLGGDKRTRYRTWLEIAAGRYDVVIGTRPAVFAPVERLGLVYVARESHPAHREDRAPYYHVRDVALARARVDGAVCVLAAAAVRRRRPRRSTFPRSRRPAALAAGGGRPARSRGPGAAAREGLASTTRGFVFSPLPGAGVAQVCRTCGEPAACASCGGLLRAAAGAVTCVVCGSPGRCRACGGSSFGVRRGGAEHVEAWAARARPFRAAPREDEPARLPAAGEILVGGPDDVRDLGPGDLDLVAILDADLADRRPASRREERSLSTWMEAVGWARPHGRAIVQSSSPGDPLVQALVRGNATGSTPTSGGDGPAGSRRRRGVPDHGRRRAGGGAAGSIP